MSCVSVFLLLRILWKFFFSRNEPTARIGHIGHIETPEWAVRIILSMGGIPVLAHPIKYLDLMEELLSLPSPIGLMGVEIISNHVREFEQMKMMLDFVECQYPHLFISIGSDC